MGNIDRFVDALAKRLPVTADKAGIEAAIRAAIAALPEAKSKFRLQIRHKEQLIIERILRKLQEAAAAAKAEAQEEEEEEEEAAESDDEEEEQAKIAAFADVDNDDPAACAEHCYGLLSAALASLTPGKRAAEALEGLMALSGAEALDAKTLKAFMRLVPLAATAFGNQGATLGPVIWRRFLAFLLISPARLAEDEAEQDPNLAGTVGALVALTAGAAAARDALRLSFDALGELPGAKVALASAAVPVLPVGFGQAALEEATLVRGDMLTALHMIHLLAACRAEQNAPALTEAQGTIRAALAKRFDATSLVPELRNIAAKVQGAKGRQLLKRLKAGSEKSREAAAAATVEVLATAHASVDFADIARLADFSGLARGEESTFDAAAAAARARGDLFFEDAGAVSGAAKAAPAAISSSAGLSEETMAAAAAAAGKRSLESIPGLEELCGKGAKKADQEMAASAGDVEDAEAAGTPSRKKRRKEAVAEAAEPLEIEKGEEEVECKQTASSALLDALAEDDDAELA